MAVSITAPRVGKWALGFSPSQGLTFLRFEFSDREPMDFAIPNEEADKIGAALVEQARLRKAPLRQH